MISLFDGFKIALVVAVLALIGGGYWHYRSVVADLQEAEAANVLLTSQRDAAISAANSNAQAAAKADADRLRVVAELEIAHAEIAAAAARDMETVREILRAPDEENGPVSPLLEKLRAKRFGGRT
ncbi:hypothetical protein [Rhizobium sp. LCM 4573]|uniref:hypothetical protein n=1 Tax=Rhizobium sp. LCM 4573 TaxID=1848291 RepID=UPI0008D91FAD|nr:hypothetical protein [Rhizobium sp. LCM 4573]OHV83636.1 hypothetical protein LCM4573_05900 [Rhizobium sp. LCM 4573]